MTTEIILSTPNGNIVATPDGSQILVADNSVDVYLGLITSEHAIQPNFTAVIATLTQPFADAQGVLASMPGLFDIGVSVGVQEDADGLWIGRSRNLEVPLTDVYFSFDTVGVGLDEGSWLGPFDPIDGLTSLSDTAYRSYLQFGIAYNNWDGSIPGIYAGLAIIFGDIPIVVQDNMDMSMSVAIFGELDAVTNALFTSGLLDMRPAGVEMDGRYIGQLAPAFGFDVEDSVIAGFDTGKWITPYPYTILGTPNQTIVTTPDGSQILVG